MNKIVYYSDELNDDFANTNIKTKKISNNFKYLPKNPFYKFFSFIFYFLIAKPLVWLCIKIVYLQKFENRKLIRKIKKEGAFIYANHTHSFADAFIPNMLVRFDKRNYIIVGPDAFSIKGISTLVKMLGGIPLPSNVNQTKNYLESIKKINDKNQFITIYPEAHIWMYYTKIRPYTNKSFKYPVDSNSPVYSLTNVYLKRKIGKRPKIKSIISGPFYPDNTLSKKESMQKLRDEVYNSMIKNNAKYESYEYKYTYKYKDPTTVIKQL